MEVNKAQAYRMYGRTDVDRWIKKGLCEPLRISPGKTRYKLFELQKLASVNQKLSALIRVIHKTINSDMATTQTIPEFFLLTSNVFWETSPVF